MKIKVSDLKELIKEQNSESNKVLLERLDIETLKKTNDALELIEKVVEDFDLPELKKGINKASKIAMSRLTDETLSGAVSGLFSGTKLSSLFSGLTAVLSFQDGVITGFRYIPEILRVLDKAIKQQYEKSAFQNVKTYPVSRVFTAEDKDAEQKLRKLIKGAFTPKGFLAQLRGIPFINDDKFVEELLELSFNELTEMARKSAKVKLPLEKEDMAKIARLAKQPEKAEKEVEPAEEPEEEEAEEERPGINFSEITRYTKRVFPGSTDKEAQKFARWLSKKGVNIKF